MGHLVIVNAIIDLLTTVLGALFNTLPTTTSGWLDATSATWSATWTTIGTSLGQWNSIIPTGWTLSTIATVLAILIPGVIAYKVANWIYKHVPQIGGFGPGSG